MLRAAAWTGGLFAVGAGLVWWIPGAWAEPAVLVALGVALLLVGGRRAATAARAGAARTPDGSAPAERAAQ